MEIKFCRRCAAPLTKLSENAYKCANGHSLFYDAAPAAVAIMLNEKGEIGLPVRAREPRKGLLCIPGGFCDYGENLETALERELREELQIEPSDYETPVYFFSTADIYEWQGNITRTLGVHFFVQLKPNVKLTPGDDIASIDFYPLDQIPYEKIAFDSNKIAIKKFVEERTKR